MGKGSVRLVPILKFLIFTHEQGGYKINFEHTDLEFDEKMVNIEMSMKRSEDRTVVNARAELFEDIDDPIVFHVSHYERVNKEYQHLMNSSVNACNVMGRFKSHPIVKIILKELLKNSNLPTSCPLKKVKFHRSSAVLLNSKQFHSPEHLLYEGFLGQ